VGAGVLVERGRQRGVPPKKDVILPLLALEMTIHGNAMRMKINDKIGNGNGKE